MSEPIRGLHHVTAIAGPAQRNLDFYAGALGLRFVKKTVNFDDPGTYHLYYGTESGAPGTAMTFFPWGDAPEGRVGAGQVAVTQFSVPPGSLAFWSARMTERGARIVAEETVFGERRVVLTDPDGLVLALVENARDSRAPWRATGVEAEQAVRGFHGVTLAVRRDEGLSGLLTDVLGYEREDSTALGAGTLTRFRSRAVPSEAGVVDLHADPSLPAGRSGTGTVHHVAFSVPDAATQRVVRDRMIASGLHVTEQIDRNYFTAIYSRVPGGILFEIATDEPGFAVDEPVETLGEALKLPPQHESLRPRIEAELPPLRLPA